MYVIVTDSLLVVAAAPANRVVLVVERVVMLVSRETVEELGLGIA